MTRAFGLKRSTSLKDKYFPLLLIVAALFFSIAAPAQSYVDTTKILQRNNTYGYDWNNGKYRGFLTIPIDTFKLAYADSGSIAYKPEGLWVWNGTEWVGITGGGGGGEGTLTSASRGLHVTGTDVRWGVTPLDSAVVIDQASNVITFHDGTFTHAWGDYVDQLAFYNILRNEQTIFSSYITDGTGDHFSAISNIYGDGDDPYVYLQAAIEPSMWSEIQVKASKLQLQNAQGNFYILDLIDSTQNYVLQYDPTLGKVTYALAVSEATSGGITGDQGITITNDSTNVQWGGIITDERYIKGEGVAAIHFILGDTTLVAGASITDFYGTSINFKTQTNATDYGQVTINDDNVTIAGINGASDSAKVIVGNVSGTDGKILLYATEGVFLADETVFDSLYTGYFLSYDNVSGQIYWTAGSGGGGGGGGIGAITGDNGITASSLTNLQWGGDLIQPTDINQAGNELVFHDGQLIHGTGAYTDFLSTYSRFRSNAAIFQSLFGDGIDGETELINNFATHQLKMQSSYAGSRSTIQVQNDKLYFFQTEGNVIIEGLIDSAQTNALFYDPGTGLITYGLAATGTGTTIAARNGLVVTGGNVELGGSISPGAPLLHNSYISSATFSLNIVGSVATQAFSVTNSHATGSAITATGGTSATAILGTGGLYGVRGVSTTGVGMSATSTSGTALEAISGNLPGSFLRSGSATTTTSQLAAFGLTTSATPASGFGGYTSINLETTSGSMSEAGRFQAKWTTPTTAATVSQLDFYNANAGLMRSVLSIAGSGQATQPFYGDGLFAAGTYSYIAGWDVDGNLIEIDPATICSGGGSGSTDEFDPIYFDVQDRDISNPITLKTDVVALQTDITAINGRLDSLLNDFPAGDANAVNDRLDSLLNNFPSGSIEVNTIDFTLTVDGNRTIPSESILEYVLVKPTVSLLSFQVGTLADADFYVTGTPVAATGDWVVFDVTAYLSGSTAIYISGVTSSTDIKLIYKPIHE